MDSLKIAECICISDSDEDSEIIIIDDEVAPAESPQLISFPNVPDNANASDDDIELIIEESELEGEEERVNSENEERREDNFLGDEISDDIAELEIEEIFVDVDECLSDSDGEHRFLSNKNCRDPIAVTGSNISSNSNDDNPKKKNFSCETCGLKVKSASGLTRHCIMRHSEKPHICPHCHYTSVSIIELRKHFRLNHVKKKPSVVKKKVVVDPSVNFPCPHCTFKGGTLNKLTRHQKRVHSQCAIIFSCHLCKYVGKKPKDLKNHILEMHSKNRSLLKCRHCPFSASNFQDLESHVVSSHMDEKPFFCPHCNYGAESFLKLKQHYGICIKLKFLI